MSEILKAPFPWFGGKSRIADMVWDRFGDVDNYIEPFAGSLAVLLSRPTEPKLETVNDLDAHLVNFWRAVSRDPDAVADHADWPVTEVDLLARHKWLMSTGIERITKLKTDPDYFDAQVAGWWVWGVCIWIGGGWCSKGSQNTDQYLPMLNSGRGINRSTLPHLGPNRGIHQSIDSVEEMENDGRGNHRKLPGFSLDSQKQKLPRIGAVGVNKKLPYLSSEGQGINSSSRRYAVKEYFQKLATRLREVRIACGDWSRVLGPAVTTCNGTTGILMDPPYLGSEHCVKYASDNAATALIAVRVKEWCVENGSNPMLRIALCGYEAKGYEMPDDWEVVEWKAVGGYGNQGEGKGRENAGRERIWFSPHCLKPAPLHELLNTEINPTGTVQPKPTLRPAQQQKTVPEPTQAPLQAQLMLDLGELDE